MADETSSNLSRNASEHHEITEDIIDSPESSNEPGLFDGLLQASWLPKIGLSTDGFSRLEKIRYYLLLALLTLLCYLVLEPLLQPFIAEAWKFIPAILLGAIGLTFAVSTVYRISHNDGKRSYCQAVTGVIALVLAGLLVYLNTASWAVESNMARVLDPSLLKDLPVSVQDRVLPKVLADEYAKQGNRNNEMIAESSLHLLVTNQGMGNLSWQTAYKYDKGLSQLPKILLGSVEKVVGLNAGVVDMSTDLVSGSNAKFVYGADSWLTHLIFRWLHPFSHEGQVSYYQNLDDSWVILLSYWSYTPTITGVSIPQLSGVMEISRYGLVKNFSPSQAAERYEGAILYPTELVRRYAAAYAEWHTGFTNVVFTKSGIEEISEDPQFSYAHNPMPYVQNFEGLGLQEYIALEPKGNNSYALSRLMFFDTETGKASEYIPSERVSYNGPRKAIINVINADPEVNWANFDKVEPLLVTYKDGQIYFLVNAIRADENTGVHTKGFLVLVDSSSLHPQKFVSGEQLRAFNPVKADSIGDSVNLIN